MTVGVPSARIRGLGHACEGLHEQRHRDSEDRWQVDRTSDLNRVREVRFAAWSGSQGFVRAQ